MSSPRKALFMLCLLVVAAGGAYYYRDEFYQNGKFRIPFVSPSALERLKKEIITSEPLRYLKNSPNAYLTRPGTIALTNKERTKVGLNALHENSKLNAAAELKLKDMFEKQYFEHISPSGAGPSDLADKAGYSYIVIGENLAMGNIADDAELMKLWMESPHHRDNILHESYEEIGVAVGKGMYEGAETWLAVQEFGKPASSCPKVDEALQAHIESAHLDLEARSMELDRRQEELNNEKPRTKQEADEYNEKVAEYNKLVNEYKVKEAELQKEVSAYNAQVRAYNDCLD